MKSIKTRHRKSIRLKEYDYSSPGEYFITICTHSRECILGDIINNATCLSQAGIIAEECWEKISGHFPQTELDSFVIMPNHIHGILVLMEPVGATHESPLQMTQQQRRNMKLSKIIGWFKMTAAKEINLRCRMPGYSVWQRNYYERIIRNDRELDNIRNYIADNPLKWQGDEENPNQ